jgi:putative PIN family toxin of toxin-antitoxin system
MLRAVLDTNVIVSSVISKKGAPFLLIHAWHDSRFVLVTSESIIMEVQRVLSAPKLKDTFHLTDTRITRFVETLRKHAVLAIGTFKARGAIPNDPSDGIFLAAALNAKADFIVSGDKHLLHLESFQGIPIVMPRQFLDCLEQETST